MQEHSAKTIAGGFIFLEGPRWHEYPLWVSDMWGYKVHRVAEDGSCEAIRVAKGGAITDRIGLEGKRAVACAIETVQVNVPAAG